MFKCEKCRQSGQRPHRVVVERKMVQHTTEAIGPRGGRGSQIVRETRVCDECLPTTPEAPIERAEAVESTVVTISINPTSPSSYQS